MKIKAEMIDKFAEYLEENKYSGNTVDKYRRDVFTLYRLIDEAEADKNNVSKKSVVQCKMKLCAVYRPASVNSVIAAWNKFFEFCGHSELKVKALKIQKQVFCPEEKMLTKEEYKTLIKFAGNTGNGKIGMIMQTICATGIRVSELRFITAESVKQGRAVIRMKGKSRIILIPDRLRKGLNLYMKKNILKGAVFTTGNGRPIDRSNIWKAMKRIAAGAGIPAAKVFPHNLRHLFAREFYKIKKDIVKLSDVLGHSDINTTRIYMVTPGREHQKTLGAMDLIL